MIVFFLKAIEEVLGPLIMILDHLLSAGFSVRGGQVGVCQLFWCLGSSRPYGQCLVASSTTFSGTREQCCARD